MNIMKPLVILLLNLLILSCKADKTKSNQDVDPFSPEVGAIIVTPEPYDFAFKNPLKGFTTPITESPHQLGTLVHCYIKWNEIENDESDGIEKIKAYCNEKWANVENKNVKVIPRVYLHWSEQDQKHWPADMTTDDYQSTQFQERVVRLIQRLGQCWDNDSRVAFIEMGIFGKWGEHHSPDPTENMQKLVGDAFATAFKNKKVTVRHVWNSFSQHPFGEYWDSWAHYDQMWGHGNGIKKFNDKTQRYMTNMIGGEVAYDWGNFKIQPGESPTHSVSEKNHRDFVINSIRWLHCTQLRWISNYDKNAPDAIKGAEEIHKAMGYRYVLNNVKFSTNNGFLNLSFSVTNIGSAPFYYQWPVEIALLDEKTLQPVWKSKIANVDIRQWMPGENWTSPSWTKVQTWQGQLPDENWNTTSDVGWAIPPKENIVSSEFNVKVQKGTYILSISVLDPASDLPSIKFATKNYLNGARHPIGLVDLNTNTCYQLPENFIFNDPNKDNTLHY